MELIDVSGYVAEEKLAIAEVRIGLHNYQNSQTVLGEWVYLIVFPTFFHKGDLFDSLFFMYNRLFLEKALL